MADLIQSDSLHYLAYNVLGQRLEAWLVNLFVFWCVSTLLIASRGKTRILGFVAMSIVVGLTIYQYSLAFLGIPIDEDPLSDLKKPGNIDLVSDLLGDS